MKVDLEWLGCATFRLSIDELTVFLDAYIDRASTAPPVGLSVAEVRKADFILVGHSHFDHLSGAEVIARNTGARIIGSNESCRVMMECGVPREQLLPSQGGERHRLSDGVTARVFPSLHSCLWAGIPEIDEVLTGHEGLTEDDRNALMAEGGLRAAIQQADPERGRIALEHIRSATGSPRDGGSLVYLIETPVGAVFYQDTSGCWSGVMRDLRADAAVLALSARANLDGEPFQGSLAQFAAREASWLGARTVVFGHHDNWLGLQERDVADISPARREIARVLPDCDVAEVGYLERRQLLA